MLNSTFESLVKDNFEHYQVMWNKDQFHFHNAHHLDSLVLLSANDEQLKDIYENTMRSSLIDVVLGDIFHPIIHVSYAIELNNRLIACEALTITAVCAGHLYKVPIDLKPPINEEKEALQIMKEIRSNDNVPQLKEPLQLDFVFSQESTILAHYNQWKMPDDLNRAIEELFDMSVQRQPKINRNLIDNYKTDENKYNWEYIIERTLNIKLATEVHAVKVIRALKDAEKDYGLKDGLYLKTALKTVDYLKVDKPWIGMSVADREFNIKH
ncbi:hypothetical protein I4U23_027311 [Adineta vaga]|nr:hypothetical protein I4U23_027311 [Adineta vaga]